MRLRQALALCVAAAAGAAAFTFTPASHWRCNMRTSAMARHHLVPGRPTRTVSRSGARSMEMKRKGKPNVPINARGGYNNMRKMQEAMMQQKNAGNDGNPIFDIFVRTKRANLWYPAASLAGDKNAKATVDAWLTGFVSGLYEDSLKRGIATSVNGNRQNLLDGVFRTYPELRKEKEGLEFGFKIRYPGLEEKKGKQEVTVITADMSLNFFDKMKKNIGL